jgi:hypothetical protein
MSLENFPFTLLNDGAIWCCGMPDCGKHIPKEKKSLIVYHKNKHFPSLKCEHCGDLFPQKANLDAHIRVKHTGEKPYKCNHCDKAYPQMSNLKDHVSKHHPEALVVAAVPEAPTLPPPKVVVNFTQAYKDFYEKTMPCLKSGMPNSTHVERLKELKSLWANQKTNLATVAAAN